jgi:hypothetical protein
MAKGIFRLKILTLFCFLFFQTFLLSQSSDIKTETQGTQIITEAQIKAAGIINLSDILLLANNWSLSTIDGFSKTVSANNLSSYQRQNFILMIDGCRYDINIFDVQNINLLPVSIAQIDYVELISVPRIVEGNFVECGLINFHTKAAKKGASVHAVEIIGNETGDPGPYRYTDYSTPNVDKIGPFFSAGVNYGSKNWSSAFNFKNEETYDTDPVLNARVLNLSIGGNKTSLLSGWGQTIINWPFGVTQFSGGVTKHDEFFFFKPYGNEIPVERNISYVGGVGNVILDNNISVNYAAEYSTNAITKRENKINFDFDFNLENYSGRFEGLYKNDLFASVFGIGIKTHRVFTSRAIDINKYSSKNIYSSFTFAPTNDFSQSFQLFFQKDRNENSIKWSLFNCWLIDAKNKLSSNFSYFETPVEEDMSYYSWTLKGYDISNELGIKYNIYGSPNKSKTFTADLSYLFKCDSALSFNLSGSYRRFANHYLEMQPYQYDEQTSTFSAPIDLYTNEALKTISFNFEIKQTLSPVIRHSLAFNYQRYIGGSDLFKEVWDALPNTNITYTIEYNPAATFGIWAKIKYLSSSFWYDYKYSDVQTSAMYGYELKPKAVFDLSFQKWFLHKIIWTNLLLRNLFNQNERYSPIGANLNLTFFIQAHFYFDTLPE